MLPIPIIGKEGPVVMPRVASRKITASRVVMIL